MRVPAAKLGDADHYAGTIIRGARDERRQGRARNGPIIRGPSLRPRNYPRPDGDRGCGALAHMHGPAVVPTTYARLVTSLSTLRRRKLDSGFPVSRFLGFVTFHMAHLLFAALL